MRAIRGLAAAAALLAATSVLAQPVQPVLDGAKALRPSFLQFLQRMVEIESGSQDKEGLDRVAEIVAAKFRALGGEVQLIETAEADIARQESTPPKPGKIVRATFKGRGTKKVLLLAHMDTVYQRGDLAKQPFRLEGDKVFGLGIADCKQGIAVIAHTVELLQALRFDEFGTLTVLINADEEIGSPASRKLITALGREHDATMSFEGSGVQNDRLSLTTAGIGSVKLTVRGRSSHAGSSPHLGVNALYELSHQILNMRDLSDPATGAKMNWTIAKAGSVVNMIPDEAVATADVRVLKVADYEVLEAKVRERAKKQLIPEAKVDVEFRRGRPPLQLTEAARRLATHSQAIAAEIGEKIGVEDTAQGGGTDAAYAALETRNAVVERYGMRGAGAHSSNAEYVMLGNIEPRMYLAARTIMDISRDKVR